MDVIKSLFWFYKVEDFYACESNEKFKQIINWNYDEKQFINLNPSEAKRSGRRVKLRSDWEQVKVGIMRDICKAKFEQNENLRQQLIATGSEPLEEGNTWGDRIWGTVDGVGQNHLGKILMEIRNEYR